MYPDKAELARVTAEGVIKPESLKAGTFLYIETTKTIYEFIKTEDAMYVTSASLTPGKHLCDIAGSLTEHGTLFAHLVVRKHHLIIDLKKQGRFVTGLIQSASLQGPDWKYEVWPSPIGIPL
jgi:hypothetical protein